MLTAPSDRPFELRGEAESHLDADYVNIGDWV